MKTVAAATWARPANSSSAARTSCAVTGKPRKPPPSDFVPDPETGGRLCYSGDLFRQDEEGFFYFVGRKDDIIKSRGEKVAPKEVETVLCALPGVAEAAVLGAPDPVLGQAIKAFVVRRDATLTATQVLAHCRAYLEDFMVPQTVEFRGELPRNNSGKVDKPALFACVASRAS